VVNQSEFGSAVPAPWDSNVGMLQKNGANLISPKRGLQQGHAPFGLIDHLVPFNGYRHELFLFAPSELRVLHHQPQDVPLDSFKTLISSAPHLLSLLQTHHHWLTILMQQSQMILELQDLIDLTGPDSIEHLS
jgi:hypothetical protein